MKIVNIIFFIFFTSITLAHTSDDIEFNKWLNNFKIYAEKEGISTLTINNTMNNVKYLPKVIKYDRYQPEFYEDTATYINKRVNKSFSPKQLKLLRKFNRFYSYSVSTSDSKAIKFVHHKYREFMLHTLAFFIQFLPEIFISNQTLYDQEVLAEINSKFESDWKECQKYIEKFD